MAEPPNIKAPHENADFDSGVRLTDEQVAEVRRRRAKKSPTYISLADARGRFGA